MGLRMMAWSIYAWLGLGLLKHFLIFLIFNFCIFDIILVIFIIYNLIKIINIYIKRLYTSSKLIFISYKKR